jgi:nucleotidyltransferase/DNA polymerase involved in DNA repair
MPILCLIIPHLPVEWESKRHPELAQAALVIGGFPHERKTVFDCSEKATASGIYLGMTLRQASHRCPDAIFLPVDEAGYNRAFDEVLDTLDQFSPVVEADSPGRAFLDISGTEHLFGPAENLASQASNEIIHKTGLQSQIGIASNKFVASIAASLASTRSLILTSGQEQSFLQPLSIEFLPIAPEAITWLNRLGLRTMGQVADLPINALDSQLGQDGLMAHRLANGIDERPIVPRPRPDMLDETLSFEPTLESLDALLAALGVLLDKLIPLLRSRYQVCPQVRLQFRSDDGKAWLDTVNLKTPSDAKPEMMGILKRHLESRPFPGEISEVYLGLAKLCGEFGRQPPLSAATRSHQQESLRRLERGLEDRFGHNPLKRVVEIDPDSRIPERRVALVDSQVDG